jgi:hypothetical protein
MNSKLLVKPLGILLLELTAFLLPPAAPGYEIFIYRRYEQKHPFFPDKKLFVHGELFGQLQAPSTFPSYNDLTGGEDRWNFGFRNTIFLTAGTLLDAQLVTHDNGDKRTKFDWHFSLHQDILKKFVLIIGHDSDHDSDHTSYLHGRPYYTNRNYIGFAIPFGGKNFVVEPFTRFFHHTNQRSFLDLSGSKLKQEYGMRIGAILGDYVTLSAQVMAQSDTLFYKGQAWLADMIFRFRLADWFELAAGASVWKDMERSLLGNKQSYYKFIWGIAIPF